MHFKIRKVKEIVLSLHAGYIMSTCSIVMLTCDFKSHVNIIMQQVNMIMLHFAINKSHVNIIMLHVDIMYRA